MFKKILFSFTTLLAVDSVNLIEGESVSAATEGNFEYEIVGGTAEITGYNGPGGDLTIPGELGGVGVTSIGEKAFEGNTEFYETLLTSVVIPEGVTHIGLGAFNNNSITNISFPQSLIHIEQSAFMYNEITDIVIPKNVKHIGRSAFSYNASESLSLPEGLEHIGHSAFGWNSFETVVIPKSVATMDGNAFIFNNLSSVTVLNKDLVVGTAFIQNPPNIAFKGYAGSSVETFALANGHSFEALPYVEAGSGPNAAIPTTVVVVPGTLTFANELVSIYADKVSLNGQSQTITALFNNTLDVIDARGVHTGYDIQVSLTDLVSGTNVISKDNITFKGLNTIFADGVSGPVENVSGASDFSLINLGAGQGIGQHTLDFSNAEMDVFVSDKTKSGIYDGTMTLSLVTTP